MSAHQSDETDVSSFLSNPLAHDRLTAPVEVVETHAARIFLAGEKAFKVKKHVKFPFLDFSTLAARRSALERELALNKAHAPDLYRTVRAIRRKDDGTLSFAGAGTIIDYALEMRRFDQSALLSRIADQGPLAPGLCKELALMVARYHLGAPAITDLAALDAMRASLATLLAEAAQLSDVLSASGATAIGGRIVAAFEKANALMEERTKMGAVRRCHGDLHLNNIVMREGRPVPFDALEFDERLAVIDVLYDLAFLLMDLDCRGDRNAANLVLCGYVNAAPLGGETAGLALLPLFLAMRALVRTIVAGERARQLQAKAASAAKGEAARYLDLANAYLAPPKPCLIAVGGLSGSGKSTLAALLAPRLGAAPGALHLRSDIARKRLFGVDESVRLGPEAYTEEVSSRVFAGLYDQARTALEAGHAAIVDMVAAQPGEREAIAEVAKEAGVPFAGLWLQAPLPVLLARVSARRGDASDADPAVVKRQTGYETGDIAWHRIDTSGGLDATLSLAVAALRGAGVEVGPRSDKIWRAKC